MAPKRASPLDDPPAASSSEEEEASSEEEDEEASGSEEETQNPKASTLSSPTPVAGKKPPASNSKPESSSGSESDAESSSDSEPADSNVKPIASKPMEETPKAKRSRSKPSATTSRPSAKRPSESEVKDSKRAKKKGSEPDADGEDEPKKSGDDSKKLFQRLWSEDDEIEILKGMIDYAAKKGADPYADMNAFHDFIKKSLHVDVSKSQLSDKVRRLKKKYENNASKKKYNPTKPHDQKAFELSKKIWGGEGTSGRAEQLKANGTPRINQKSNSKTLSLLKTELLSSPEASKQVENIDIDQSESLLGSLNGIIGFDKSLGLPAHVVKQGLDLISEPKKAELEAKWKKIHIAEVELFVKRTQLMSDQAKLVLEALKSSDH